VSLSMGALNLLGLAYREGDFAVAYPTIRGLIPVVLVLAAVPLFGEKPTPAGIVGVLCVSAGLGLMAWDSARRSRTMTTRGLAFAGFAATVTAASVMTDTMGARLSQNPLGYAATISVLNGFMMAVLHAPRRNVPAMILRHWPVALFGGLVSMASYAFIWSVTRTPVAMVPALRETSMLFALAIAALVLRERFGPWRWAAVATMLGGVVLIRL
jgi:drug/metabolite transporter (DMT)-like permease